MLLYCKTKDNGLDVYDVQKDEDAIENYKIQKINEQISKNKKIVITYATPNWEFMKNFKIAENIVKSDYTKVFKEFYYSNLESTNSDLIEDYLSNGYCNASLEIFRKSYKNLVASNYNQLLGGLFISDILGTYNNTTSKYEINNMLYLSREQMILHYLEIGDFINVIRCNWSEQLKFFDFQLIKTLSCYDLQELEDLELLDYDKINQGLVGTKVLKKVNKTIESLGDKKFIKLK